mmetsp:Transcript_41619/g.56516  ORF Transcript_41619/g.56516 Transcript_41619/m.56516 type:complete len:84 (-) Transcript_41619:49-300(-)
MMQPGMHPQQMGYAQPMMHQPQGYVMTTGKMVKPHPTAVVVTTHGHGHHGHHGHHYGHGKHHKKWKKHKKFKKWKKFKLKKLF